MKVDYKHLLRDKHEILAERARKLARKLQEKKHEDEVLEIVLFRLGDEVYGLELTHIMEVYLLRSLTTLPGVPAFVLGIINVRGQIVSVIDLKIFFEMTSDGLPESARVIILQSGEMEFGILADAILGVETILKDEIMPSLPTLTGIRANFLKGVSQDHIVILDGEKLLTNTDLIVNQEVA